MCLQLQWRKEWAVSFAREGRSQIAGGGAQCWIAWGGCEGLGLAAALLGLGVGSHNGSQQWEVRCAAKRT